MLVEVITASYPATRGFPVPARSSTEAGSDKNQGVRILEGESLPTVNVSRSSGCLLDLIPAMLWP